MSAAVSTLGMTLARRRIFEAGNAAHAARQAEIVASEARAKAEAAAHRQAVIDRQAAALAQLLDAMPSAAEKASRVSRPRAIVRAVAEQHGIAVAQLTDHCRSKKFVLARQEAMWAIKQATGASLPEIGRAIGGRDHTTILWGIRQHQARLDSGSARQAMGEGA